MQFRNYTSHWVGHMADTLRNSLLCLHKKSTGLFQGLYMYLHVPACIKGLVCIFMQQVEGRACICTFKHVSRAGHVFACVGTYQVLSVSVCVCMWYDLHVLSCIQRWLCIFVCWLVTKDGHVFSCVSHIRSLSVVCTHQKLVHSSSHIQSSVNVLTSILSLACMWISSSWHVSRGKRLSVRVCMYWN